MPFTFAHPAVVIPLRRHAPLSALVIGSMVPDLAHFLALPLPRQFTHSLPGLPLFCLPAGLLIHLLFHGLLRDPLIALGPVGLSQRLPARPRLPATIQAWLLVALGVLIGAGSHLLWDGATTFNWKNPLTRPLVEPLFVVLGTAVSVRDLLRHGSAVLGLALIAHWLRRWWQQAPLRADAPVNGRGPQPLSPGLRAAVIGVGLLAVLAFAIVAANSEVMSFEGRNTVGRAARAAMPAVSLLLLSYALGWQAWRLLQSRR